MKTRLFNCAFGVGPVGLFSGSGSFSGIVRIVWGLLPINHRNARAWNIDLLRWGMNIVESDILLGFGLSEK